MTETTTAYKIGVIVGSALLIFGVYPLVLMFIWNVGVDALFSGHQGINWIAGVAITLFLVIARAWSMRND